MNQSKEYIVTHNKALAIQHILTHDKQYLDFDKDKEIDIAKDRHCQNIVKLTIRFYLKIFWK